jgi:hypothetical protein
MVTSRHCCACCLCINVLPLLLLLLLLLLLQFIALMNHDEAKDLVRNINL